MKWQDDELAVVTGGGTGLGRALAHGLAKQGANVLIVGRREEPLKQTASFAPENISYQAADLASEDGRDKVANAIPQDKRVRSLIHNAGMLEPIGPLAEVELEQWRKAIAINVEAPLFLTKTMLAKMQQGGRVMHVSSGAAHKAMVGWGTYCTGKAALFMLYEVLKEELWDQRVLVGSVRPGVVDTPMQELIRQQTPERFPAVNRFVKLKENNQLYKPEEAADFILWALLETADKQFVEQEWNIGDEDHAKRWQETRSGKLG
ncbi:SDR family NAD(P)-dependent oxidoreductase [Halorhodospira halochloris]|uniref:SDR family NAD(P)-dependent oxidoreductase n=1 Tax=Halorhodospira halochloris TaxID=1052 RepID=UPI001EE8996E|nr:SDR family NAD(P)-dependent oxidoreductase [Halorhodospira halochloris]MCG5530759.1 SDR family NAD(P)-dependent oxidoreductase [Halorhodospira halochloris]